jgi:hypothetical protein
MAVPSPNTSDTLLKPPDAMETTFIARGLVSAAHGATVQG